MRGSKWCLAWLLAAGNTPAAAQESVRWPEGLGHAEGRAAAVQALADGIASHDAEAIAVDWQGAAGWLRAAATARGRASQASDPEAFGFVLRSLYDSYPSLHGTLALSAGIDARVRWGAPFLPFRLAVDRFGPGVVPKSLRVASVDRSLASGTGEAPRVGDRVVAIDGQPTALWLARVRDVCRRNAEWQCYTDFDRELRAGTLGWDPRRPLRLDVLRAGRPATVRFVPRADPARAAFPPQTECGGDGRRYAGFSPVYTGYNLCTYRKNDDPSVEVWRLKSFHYPGMGSIPSADVEISRFWTQRWRATAAGVRRVVIDLSDNRGGDVPLAWPSLLLSEPYQMEYAQYLKLRELDDPLVRAEMFEDPRHARWFERHESTGQASPGAGPGFLPPVPMFCIESDAACDGLPAKPLPSGFRGDVVLILNEVCASSCSGFARSILTGLGPRGAAVGLPDSGDINFTRLPLKLFYSGGHWRTSLGDTVATPTPPIATALVMVTRSTDASGHIISGLSLPIRTVVDRSWSDDAASWTARSLDAALRYRFTR